MRYLLTLTVCMFFNITVWSQSGIQESSELSNQKFNNGIIESELKIYPNPCNTVVNVEYQPEKISKILITNIAGKNVFELDLEFPLNKKQIQLNNIPEGIYFFRVKTEENKMVIKKLIVTGD